MHTYIHTYIPYSSHKPFKPYTHINAVTENKCVYVHIHVKSASCIPTSVGDINAHIHSYIMIAFASHSTVQTRKMK
jgi:hypothetical protein